MSKKKTIFLDRDGVVNIDKHYVYKIEDFEFTYKLLETCKYFQTLGYQLIIITNQSGIGRGYYTEEEFKKLTSWMLNEFKKDGIKITDVFYCPHSPEENCNCRKPKPGMIIKACEKYEIDLENSWMIGDKISDMEVALNAGISNRILIDNEKLDKTKDLKNMYVISKFTEVKKIISN